MLQVLVSGIRIKEGSLSCLVVGFAWLLSVVLLKTRREGEGEGLECGVREGVLVFSKFG